MHIIDELEKIKKTKQWESPIKLIGVVLDIILSMFFFFWWGGGGNYQC